MFYVYASNVTINRNRVFLNLFDLYIRHLIDPQVYTLIILYRIIDVLQDLYLQTIGHTA